MLKNALYLVLISLIILTIYFVTADNVGPRLGAAVTCCLTTAVVQGKLDSGLPPLGTLVAIEYAFYALYLLVFMSVVISLVASYHQSDKLFVKRMCWLGVTSHTLVCAMIVGGYYLLYYL